MDADGQELDEQIDAFVAASRLLDNQRVLERPQWNTRASSDAIRHFCDGVGDDNPRWLNANRNAGIEAPPMFLASIAYPALHGAPMKAPLTSLIGELEYVWDRAIPLDAVINAEARQTSLEESVDRQGRRLVLVKSEVEYSDPDGASFGSARTVLVRIASSGPALLLERTPVPYSPEQAQDLRAQILDRPVRGRGPILAGELQIGASLPQLVIGPLTVGDLVCWQAAIGPSYRSGTLALSDGLRAPHTMVTNPAIGWHVKSSQEHEDSALSAQRGMPAPFDNSVMRMSQMSRLLTDWMGDAARLTRLHLRFANPVIYGDVTWYAGTIVSHIDDETTHTVTVRITGKNQLGEINTEGEAEVVLAKSSVVVAPPRPLRQKSTRPDLVASIPVLLTSTAEKHPGRLAIWAADGGLTYGELVEQACTLSYVLEEQGVGPGTIVGLAVPRTSVLPVAALAVLMRGAAYCPLDSTLPHERQKQLIASADPSVVVAPPEEAASLVEHDLPTVDPHQGPGGRHNNHATAGRFHSRHNELAYVIHTSGSQGAPKAVGVSHGAMAQYMAALGRTLSVTKDDRYLLTASLSFSAASRQLWYPLSVGAQVVIDDVEQTRYPLSLFALMRDAGVKVWDTVPSLWASAITALEAIDGETRPEILPPELQTILATGEALPWRTAERWRTLGGSHQTLVNLYSQTETAGTACTYVLPDERPDNGEIVPIGSPMHDTTVHVLNEDRHPVAPGQVGELWVENDRLATGYLDDSDNGRFVRTDARGTTRHMYRTGDRGQIRPDENLEVVGRIDSRLKVRGFRVEPGEVEVALERRHDVTRAAVTARPEHGGSLVAYLEVQGPDNPPSRELRSHLASILPSYAIPSTFEVLDRLPLNPNGKVDRAKLQSLAGERLSGGGVHRATTTSHEAELADLYQEVLNTTEVGIDDDFLELGGHSLLAIELSTLIQQELGVHVPIGDLFEHSTVAKLSAHITELLQSKNELPPLVRVPRVGPLTASPMQEGLWMLNELNPGKAFYNLSWAMTLEGAVDIELFAISLAAMASRHDSLRTTFEVSGSGVEQVVAPRYEQQLQVVDLQDLGTAERRAESIRIATADGKVGFDLGRGPLFRFKLIREDPESHVFTVVAHHTVADMVSMAVLVDDLLTHYDAARRGDADPLPQLAVQPADVAAWHQAMSKTDWYVTRLAERVSALAGVANMKLPSDNDPSPPRSHRSISSTRSISKETADSLRNLARGQRATMFMTCLAGFKMVLRNRCNDNDVLVSCPVVGRDRAELKRLVGMLVNTLPIRTDLTGLRDYQDVLEAVRESSREAFRHTDLPFARVVGALHLGRDAGELPLGNVFFQLQEDPMHGVGLEDLEVSRLSIDLATTAFDMEMSIKDTGGELRVTIIAAEDLFSPATIEDWLDEFINILTAAPDRPRYS